MANLRLKQQMQFLVEIDKLKGVFRRTYLADGSRKENDAEHSWHFAIAAILLAEHAAEPIDVLRAAKMALIHDLVEIDAGDVTVYDLAAREAQKAKERAAAERIFALLPADQAKELRAIWEEFEARQTPEARFAAAIDRMQSILLNVASGGRTWREIGVTADRVRSVNSHIAQGSPAVWEFVQEIIDQAVAKRYFPEKP
jgi:putative hydrolases of HD superfamily